MPVVIAGSGRCGTSMVTQMLSVCGLYIGEEADMNSPGDWDNPNGYWENRALYQISTRILERFGGTDKGPPILAAGWEDDPAISDLYAEAERAIARHFAGRDPWGWKDPRASTTVAFWRRVVPDLKFVLCVRNPLDVAKSLSRHLSSHGAHQYRFEGAHGFLIWYYYNAALLCATDPSSRLVTFYEDYFPDYTAGLAPVLEFAGLPAVAEGSDLDRKLRGLHDPTLKHHSSTLGDVIENSDIPYIVRELYRELAQAKETGEEPGLLQHSDAIMPLVQMIVALEDSAAENRRMEAVLNTRPHRVASAVSRIVNRLPLRRPVTAGAQGKIGDKSSTGGSVDEQSV